MRQPEQSQPMLPFDSQPVQTHRPAPKVSREELIRLFTAAQQWWERRLPNWRANA